MDKIMEITDYMQYKETKLHDRPGFAYNTYLCTIPLDFPEVELHWHEQMEIIYIKKGNGRVTLNLQPYEVSAGCIIPVLPGELHSIEKGESERMEYENIIFSLSVFDSADEDDWCRENVIEALKKGSLFFDRIIKPGTSFHVEASKALDGADEACKHRVPGFSLLVKSEIYRFFYALYKYGIAIQPGEVRKDTQNFKEVLSWVRIHYGESITVSEAAAQIGFSTSHFMRVFKKKTGHTFVTFLTDYRLANASYYLKETDRPVGEIAQECGFDNFSYFIRKFRAKYGVSPREYRKITV